MPKFLNVIRSSESPYTVHQHFTDEPSSSFPFTQFTNQALVDTNVNEFENSSTKAPPFGRVSTTGKLIRTGSLSVIEISSDDELEDSEVKYSNADVIILNVETRKLTEEYD